jgi:hypothetical protein
MVLRGLSCLKSAAYESLGKIKRQNRRKYLKIWDDQIEDQWKPRKYNLTIG